MNIEPRIIFFGNERLATGLGAVEAVTLRALIQAGYRVSAVVSRPSQPAEADQAGSVEAIAQAHSIPLHQPRTAAELAGYFERFPDQFAGAAAGVLVAFGLLVPEPVIARFPRGIINIHPSLLPRYRGSSPIEQTILDGATATGVSLMQLTAKMDAGGIYAQQEVTLSAADSKLEVAAKMQDAGALLLKQHLEAILTGEARVVPQDESAATYTHRLTKADGVIDWRKPVAQLEREVRAFLGWPGSRTTLFGRGVAVTEARVVPQGEARTAADAATHLDFRQPGTVLRGWPDRLFVTTGDGVLEILQLTPAGKRPMDMAAFLRGIPA